MFAGNPSPEYVSTLLAQIAALQSGSATLASLTALTNTVNSKVTKVNLLADLQALTPITDMKVQMIGAVSLTDGLGGLYYWDATAVTAADNTYYNIIQATGFTTGRWTRCFQKVRTTAGGAVVVSVGPVKFVFVAVTTDSSGDATINLTEEGTSTGTAIFTTLWWYDARAASTATGVTSAVNTYFQSNTSNKSLVFGNYKANALTLTLGLLYNPFAACGSGVSVLAYAAGV